jgi:hypothetical protein
MSSLSFSLGQSVLGLAQVEVHLAFGALWAYWILSSLWAGNESWGDIFFIDAILYGPILLFTLLVHGLVHAYTALQYGKVSREMFRFVPAHLWNVCACE